MIVAALAPQIDAQALVAGFFFGAFVTVIFWAALFGVYLLRRMLSDASAV